MRRALLQSRWFRELWGDKVQLAGDRNQAAQYMNTRRGQMIASSVGGTLMGKGFDTAILDDLVSPMQSASDAERTTANNWLDNTCFSRVNDPSTAAFVAGRGLAFEDARSDAEDLERFGRSKYERDTWITNEGRQTRNSQCRAGQVTHATARTLIREPTVKRQSKIHIRPGGMASVDSGINAWRLSGDSIKEPCRPQLPI
jgi:hypothetical protein